MKFIAISILICLAVASDLPLGDGLRNWISTGEFNMKGLNLDRAEYISADLNFGLSLNTFVTEDSLSWFNQYINYTTGTLYHHDGTGCQAFAFESLSLDQLLDDMEKSTIYMGKRGVNQDLFLIRISMESMNQTLFAYWNEDT